MKEEPRYEEIKTFSNDFELMHTLKTGNFEEKKHALLNLAYGNGNGEVVFDALLSYINDVELKSIAYLCINQFLETCRSYPLSKILSKLIEGLNNEEKHIRIQCESAFGNLIRPGKITTKSLDFSSFQIQIENNIVKKYLNSPDAEKIIIGILYTFHKQHEDTELFTLLNQQLAKKIKSVTCIIGKIIDFKLCGIIDQLEEIEETSIKCYKNAEEFDLKQATSGLYDRYDEIQYLANGQMINLRS